MIILDGGMSRVLQDLGAPFRQPEWSALALLETPDLVETAHRAFVDAGADVLTTNTFAVVPFHLGDDRFDRDGAELAALAAVAARRAAESVARPVLVAGSLPPPAGAYLPHEHDAARAAEVWDVLIAAQRDHVDLWLAETLASLGEVADVLDALDRAGAEGERWIALWPDPDDAGRLGSGEPLAAVGELADRFDAVLVNCAPPEQLDQAVPVLRSGLDELGHDTVRVGGYANLFVGSADSHAANEDIHDVRDMDPAAYRIHVERWLAAGADIIGGCCGVGPAHIGCLLDQPD